MLKNKWTEKEINYLKKYYCLKGKNNIAQELNRSEKSVRRKAENLDLVIGTKEVWEDGEIKFIKENYQDNGSSYCAKQLNRSEEAIRKKAQQLNIKYNKNNRKIINKSSVQEMVNVSYNKKELLENLGVSPYGANYKLINYYISEYGIDISHFDPFRKNKQIKRTSEKPIQECLKNKSNVSSSRLKHKLYKYNLKEPICELCGQDEYWQGKKMSLILDHINGVNNDNRFENLRIVCPNCNATLETHCKGKNT